MCKEKILQMLEDGKINADEAVKLLLAINGQCEKKSCGIEHKIKKLSKCVDSIARDLGDKVGSAYKYMEPKLKETVQCIAKKTSDVMRDLYERLSTEKSCDKPDDMSEED